MHERSLVRSLIAQVNEELRNRGLTSDSQTSQTLSGHTTSNSHRLPSKGSDLVDHGTLTHLRGIRLEIGEFSGVEPSLIQLAFDEMAVETWGHTVELDLEIIPLIAECLTCNTRFRVEGFRFVCPDCHGTNVQIRSGEQMQLVSMDIEPMGTSESSTV